MIFSPYDTYCWPDTGGGFSDDHNVFFLANDLFGVSIGISGSTGWGAQCWPPNGGSPEMRGRIGFTIGSLGSWQDNDKGQPIDDNLTLQYGMPYSIGATWGYPMWVDSEGAKHNWTTSDFTTYYIGASNRYCIVENEIDNVKIHLQVDLIGDAARLAWTLQGTDDTVRQWALWFGQWVTMASATTGAQQGATFVSLPNSRPITTDTSISYQANPTLFPEYIDFAMNQQDAYGLQILNGPTAATEDVSSGANDASQAQSIDIGNVGWLLNGVYSNDATMPDVLVPDVQFVYTDPTDPYNPRNRDASTAYIQKFALATIPAVSTPSSTIQPQWVCYYKSTTGVSNYALPYAAVVDTPKLIQVDANNPAQFDYPVHPQDKVNGEPRYYIFRVYVDNVGGFGKIDREIPLEGVKVTLNLPDGMFWMNPAETDPLNPKNPQRKVVTFIDRVEPRAVGHVDFKVGVNANAFGTLSYQVLIEPASAIKKKNITGTVVVASQPRLQIRGEDAGNSGANLVSLPWVFQNTNWETILSSERPMILDQNFRAFKWDALNQQYIPQTGPERGIGTWIISKPDLGFIRLQGQPTQATDLYSGAPLLTLHSGWNLIGNPYNYQFPVAQIVGVSGAIGDTASTFQELVDAGIVSGSLAWWDADNQVYRYVNVTGNLVPNRGYWIYVATAQDLLLRMPPIFQPFLTYQGGPSSQQVWVQNDKHWRLQIAARTAKSLDDQNFVGRAASALDVKRLRAVDPPVAPIDGAVNVGVKDLVEGKPMRMASAFTEKAGRQEWEVEVNSKQPGQVTVTWPNLSTLPRNLKVRLVDGATGATRDLRRSSGYTFTTDKPDTTRTFKIQVEPGMVASTKITNVVVANNGRGPRSSVSVQYTLTGDASTTVRILGRGGREIYVPTRGRADHAGPNTVVWNLRDAANRAQAPGVYSVEIVAETSDGQRVRRIVPINVTR